MTAEGVKNRHVSIDFITNQEKDCVLSKLPYKKCMGGFLLTVNLVLTSFERKDFKIFLAVLQMSQISMSYIFL